MPTRLLKYVVEIVAPAGFKSSLTRAILEKRIREAWPNCAVRVFEYNRSAVAREDQAREPPARKNQGIEGTPLQVPFAFRHEARALGALWDRENHLWVAPPGTDPRPFRERGWLD